LVDVASVPVYHLSHKMIPVSGYHLLRMTNQGRLYVKSSRPTYSWSQRTTGLGKEITGGDPLAVGKAGFVGAGSKAPIK